MAGGPAPGGVDALVVLDVGTTSTRASVRRLDGSVVAMARLENALFTPTPDRAEQDPVALRSAAETVISQAVAEAGSAGVTIHGLVLSTHMHSLLRTDAGGAPLTPLITWADTRADPQSTQVRSRPDWLELYARTGCPPHASYPLYKLMWLDANGQSPRPPDRVSDLKGWLIRSWTGAWVVDRSIASGTGMLELRALSWDAGALEMAGISVEQLPAIVDTSERLPSTSDRLGLPMGTPVVVGAGDGVLSSLGSGAHLPGIAAVMAGTSAAVRVPAPSPVADHAGRLFSYYLANGRWIVGGAISNGGIVLDWLGDMVGLDPADVLAVAAEAPAGAAGLVALPLLAGERAPGYDGRARGAWFGLGLDHHRPHLARASLEGVAFRVRSVLEAAEEALGPATDIRATGGLARSPLWLSILSSVLGRRVTVPDDVEGTTVGALMLGAVALGLLPDLDAAAAGIVQIGEVVQPQPQDAAVYALAYPLYQRLYASVRAEFGALAELRAMSVRQEVP